MKVFVRPLLVAALACILAACNAPGTIMENGAITLSGNEVMLRVIGSPKAVIDADGNLVIDGKPVPVTPAERELLARYNQSVRSVHETGLAMGKAGIETAAKAIAAKASSTSGEADTAAETGASKLQDLTLGICKATAAIKAAQDQLAAQLTAFKPYAAIVGADDAANCAKDAKS